jgi:hypothetical protein
VLLLLEYYFYFVPEKLLAPSHSIHFPTSLYSDSRRAAGGSFVVKEGGFAILSRSGRR